MSLLDLSVLEISVDPFGLFPGPPIEVHVLCTFNINLVVFIPKIPDHSTKIQFFSAYSIALCNHNKSTRSETFISVWSFS